MTLATKVLIGVALGVLAGVFFGEQAAFLKILGDAFVQLLQMTVLPYMMASLIVGLGGLSYQQAGTLARKCGMVLLLLWGIGLVMVLLMPLAFPRWESAAYFSTSLVEQQPAFNFHSLYIPSNLFHSLSSNTVPAVVVFSVFLGVALIGLKDKEVLLHSLATVAAALGKINGFIVKLAPLGVFAIIASATGTLRLAELRRLEVYMFTYAVASLVLTFCVLPWVVTSLTPIRYRDLLGPTRDALITAFATGNIFIVLPVLAERSKELLKTVAKCPPESDGDVDVIISTSFSFPNLGKILTLGFVLFAGWFADSAVPLSSYATFAVSGLFTFFGDPNVAIPFLLDMLQIPSDTYRFFLVVDNLVGARFGTLLAAMYTLTLAILGTTAVYGRLTIPWPRLLRRAALSAAIVVCVLGSVRMFFQYVVQHEYQEDQLFTAKGLSREYKPPDRHADTSSSPAQPGRSRVSEIKERAVLRAGYFADNLPFAFENSKGKLVGFDIEMAHRLARDMNVALELVMVSRGEAAEMVNSGRVDLIMGPVALTLERAEEMGLSTPYMQQTLAFVVRDHRREEFSSRERVRKLTNLKIGILDAPYYTAKVREYLPQAQLTQLDSPRQFFTGAGRNLDALVFSAEAGCAWTLIYPAYAVAVPRPDVLNVPLAYGVPRGDREFADFVNTWIQLKKEDRTMAALYDYWILGRKGAEEPPRWSILRNVLHVGQ